VRHTIIDVELNRPPVAAHCFSRLADLQPGVAEVQMRFRQVIQFRERAANQLDRRWELSLLIGDEPEKMQRLGMLRVFLQRVAIERLRLIEPAGLVVGEGGIYNLCNAIGRTALFVALRSHDRCRIFTNSNHITVAGNALLVVPSSLDCCVKSRMRLNGASTSRPANQDQQRQKPGPLAGPPLSPPVVHTLGVVCLEPVLPVSVFFTPMRIRTVTRGSHGRSISPKRPRTPGHLAREKGIRGGAPSVSSPRRSGVSATDR
jgi:hypothetical protein